MGLFILFEENDEHVMPIPFFIAFCKKKKKNRCENVVLCCPKEDNN